MAVTDHLIHIIRIATASVVLLVILGSVTSASEQKTYLVSYFQHPQLAPFLEVVKQSYLDIGITPEFVLYPLERGLVELEQGHVDANLIRNPTVVSDDNNLLAIRPAISGVDWYLICHPDETCTLDAFANEKTTIIATGIYAEEIAAGIAKPVRANIFRVNSIKELDDLVKAKRLRFGVIGTQKGTIPKHYSSYQMLKLYSIDAVHVIHKRHAAIADQLSEALAKRLAQMMEATSRKE